MGQETQDNIYTPKLDSVLMLAFLTLPHHLTWSWCWDCDANDADADDGDDKDNDDQVSVHSQIWMVILPVIWTWDFELGRLVVLITFFLKVQHYILHFII